MNSIKTGLATFMKIAIVAITIVTLIYGALYETIDDTTNDVGKYIENQNGK
ncbi:hypothetical protein P9Z80_13700 [Bacillus cereus]|nr:hypothetical protein [Bacillus cereus]MEC3260905.1 hypothetical protein [Bacillus cereus]